MTEPTSQRVARRALSTWVRTKSAFGREPLPVNDRGATIDPDVHAFLTSMAAAGRSFDPRTSVGAMRHDYDVMGQVLDVPKRPIADVHDEDLDLPGRRLRARIYAPRTSAGRIPALVWIHGGGWVIGSLRSHDHALRELAHLADVAVIAVDYRLGPEHRFPAAHDDALDAWMAIADRASRWGFDPDRLGLGGDSAGGNLSIATAIAVRDRRGPMPRYLALVYPAVEMIEHTPSRDANGEGFFLTEQLMEWFADRYVATQADKASPRLSVLREPSFAGMPRTLVTTAGFDPLRDEGEALVARMRKDGIDVEHRSEDRLIHGYLTMGGIVPEARRALGAIATSVRGALR